MKSNADYDVVNEHAYVLPACREPVTGRVETDDLENYVLKTYAMTALHRRLAAGIATDLEQVHVIGGVLALYGVQVIVYNPDQGEAIDEVLASTRSHTPFHLTKCAGLLAELKASGGGHHVAANSVSGHSLVYGRGREGGQRRRGLARLQVCEHCLHSLNYKGYNGHNNEARAKLREQFDMAECFARFSTLFSHYAGTQSIACEVSAWQHRPLLKQGQCGATCERCSLAVDAYPHLLYPADFNTDRQALRPAQGGTLCLDCQRKEAVPAPLPVRGADMRLIQRCRRAQGLLDDMAWDQAITLADSAFDGVLRYYRELAHTVPEIAYELAGEQGVEFLEVAWPSQKRGVTADLGTARRLARLGWHCLTLDEALAKMNDQGCF